MNNKKVAKITNVIFWVSIDVLICCIFVILCGGSVRLETLYYFFGFDSVIPAVVFIILTLFMINVMSNLSNIKEILEKTDSNSVIICKKKNKWFLIILAIIPVIITSLLFLSNHLSVVKSKAKLINSAEKILQNYSNELADICDYSFTKEWIDKTTDFISQLKKFDQDINDISIIVKDAQDEYLSIEIEIGNIIYLGRENDEEPKKYRYVYSPSTKERDYLDNVFLHNHKDKYFFSRDNLFGRNKLLFPFENGGIIIINIGCW